MIIDQLFTRPVFEEAPMASPEQLAYNRLRAQYDSYQTMTGGGGNTAVSRDPAHAAKLATIPAEIARMAAALKAKGIDAEAQYDALSGPAAAPVDANQAYGGVSEVAPPGARAERMVRHIKQGYARDGKLTPKEKGIAFATAWKAHNAGQLDEFARGEGGYGPFKVYIGNYFTDKQFSTFGRAKEEIQIIWDADPKSADDEWRIVNGTGRTVWENDPDAAFDNMRRHRKMQVRNPDEDLAEAAQGHTIEAHGVRGMDRRTWHKTFRNTDQMIAWAEKHDAEIIGTRDLEQARHHNLSPAEQGVTEGLSKRDQKDVAAIRATIERLQAQLKQPNADKAAIQQSIAHERKRLALYGPGVAEGLTEMDKSQTPPGRDTGPRSGPDQYVKPITSKQMQDRALDKLNQAVKDSHKKKDVKESDTLMMKLKRAMVREGRVKELADDLKTMADADFMKKYGKAKAAIRADMKRIDEKLTSSDTLTRPAAGASSSGKAIDDPDIMGSLRSGPKFDRLGKTGGEPEFDFRSGLVGGETEVEAEPRLMVDPLPDMQKWGGKFATGSAGGDNRFTAPTGWRYVEKGEDPARYGSGPAAATSALPNLIYDPQSRTLKSADAPALDMTTKSKFKFDRATQSQVPADGSGANPNIDAATRDRARAWAAQQNAPATAAKQKVDWKTIYALNKATIGSNPNLIRTGMKLSMPDGSTYRVQPGDNLSKIAAKQSQINELSTEKLAQYKTAAAADAKKADQEGDFKRGDRRFSGIVKATKKQFDNDAKQVDESRAARRALMARIVNS